MFLFVGLDLVHLQSIAALLAVAKGALTKLLECMKLMRPRSQKSASFCHSYKRKRYQQTPVNFRKLWRNDSLSLFFIFFFFPFFVVAPGEKKCSLHFINELKFMF